MSEQDELASVKSSIKDEIAKDALSPSHLESLYTDLPSDVTALKAIVGTMRLELSKKDFAIAALKQEMDEVKASHSVVLQRSAEWQDELESLRLRVPALQDELRNEKQAREAESDRVKDLRIRAEESRRAIMRLQGEQSDARAKAKVDNRRSWVPAATAPPPVRDEQEDAELKKSKRASLAFGPNALNLNLANRPGSSQGFGHRRTPSGTRSISGASKGENEAESEEPLSPTFANGLRGLRLSGTAGTNGIAGSGSLLTPNAAAGFMDGDSSAPNSRRSSFRSEHASKSPRLGLNDLPLPDPSADVPFSLGARLSVPINGAQRNPLLSSPALSQGAASSAGIGSPIIEDNEEEEQQLKALPQLPSRESSMHYQSYDQLGAKEVEIERLCREMTDMRLALEEAVEARKASEACLKALREFIAHHDTEADGKGHMRDDADRIVQRTSFGAGLLKGVKLPPLPTDDIDDEEEKVHLSPQKTNSGGGTGWSMKLPTLMRKATSSSSAAEKSNGPTPSDETKQAPVSSTEAEASASIVSSPNNSAGVWVSTQPSKSIASGFAGLGNLLGGRTGTTPNSEASVVTSTQAEPVGSPEHDEGGSGFKSLGGWFTKRTSMISTPNSQDVTTLTLEEKVMSPPFRSLDHDQLSITRQAFISPLDEIQHRQGSNGSWVRSGIL
ncbi:uncharacterized protein MEPE_01077 [Melanopsichium pennsylvanicum]|uniref:Uncharacterized protein n=2 Tax=Melanopsichium pennsylvanicum TaxID=63383 RepID=A0AAJ4XI24_9BASI|nr:putative protein [Melanopsichium pennsylvanicum 4]SNX82371.1 uncharacterized protein MEPE_01077 [Melanopsichium pennsylvanicum]